MVNGRAASSLCLEDLPHPIDDRVGEPQAGCEVLAQRPPRVCADDLVEGQTKLPDITRQRTTRLPVLGHPHQRLAMKTSRKIGIEILSVEPTADLLPRRVTRWEVGAGERPCWMGRHRCSLSSTAGRT